MLANKIFFALLTSIIFVEDVHSIKVYLEGQKTGIVKKKVFLGARTQLTCDPWDTNSERLRVIWTYRKFDDETGLRSSIAEDKILEKYKKKFLLRTKTTLIIKTPGRNDSGIYTCILENQSDEKLKSSQGSYNLLVMFPPSKPYCLYPSQRYLKLNEKDKIICKSDAASPKPTYSWYKDNRLLPVRSENDPRYKLAQFKYNQIDGTLHFMVSSVVFNSK